MPIAEGVYQILSNELYHGEKESYSKSSISDFAVYPLNLPFQRKNRVRKQIWDKGTAIHTAVLEPHLFEDSLAVIPPDVLGKGGAKSTKAYKAWAADQPESLSIVKQEERDEILQIRDNILSNPEHSEAAKYLTGIDNPGLPEVSCFWQETFADEGEDEETGYKFLESSQYSSEDDGDLHKVMVKVRPDYLPGRAVVVDLKTTGRLLDPWTFTSHAVSMKYHWSAFLTLRGLTRVTGVKHRRYVFVVVEVAPPYEVAVYEADQEFVAYGGKQVMHYLERLAWCDKHDKWPGFPDRTLPVGIPGWAQHQLYQNNE